MKRQNRIAKLLGSTLLLLAIAFLPAFAQVGLPGGMIHAHDMTYRTVGAPTNLPNHGMFDTIGLLGNDLAPVSEVAPGDGGDNGGRWEVRPVTFVSIPATQFTNAEQIEMAAANGEIMIGDVVNRFECPLIRAHERR